ncbi:MAG: TetR/AcrR family transcriptional regulator [Betaproteobacteria bacterium]|nr:TetR/AcrR family transcriptional regulator [Betaproteobacteria bacterium]
MKQRLKAEDRRSSILELSKGLFAKKGLHGVSVSEIAEECKVSPAVLYQHFPSKEMLYEAVIQGFACKRDDYVDAVLAGPPDFPNVLYRMTVVFVKSRIADPDLVRIELRALIDNSGISEKFFINHWQGLTDYIQFSLKEAQQSGQLKDIDGRIAAMSYVGLVREIVLAQSLQYPNQTSELGVEYLVKNAINFYLKGIGLTPLQW